MGSIIKKEYLNLKDFGEMENCLNKKNNKIGLIIFKKKMLIGL